MSASFRWVLVASLFVKAALAIAFADIEPQYDERQFLRLAQDLYEGAGPPILWRAPGYQVFMALGLALAGGQVVGVRLLQVAASGVVSFLAYRVGREQWGERAGLAAGAFVAFYPEQIAFSHLLWSETLYGLLTLAAFERLLAADRRDSLGLAVVAGLLLGASSLTRSTGLGLVAVSGLWLLLRGRPGVRLAAATGTAALCVVLPWSLHATARAGCFIAVDMNGGYNIWNGNNEYIPDGVQAVWGVGLPLENGFDPALTQFLPDDQWRDEVRNRMAADGAVDRFDCRGSAWYREQGQREIARDPASFVARAPLKLAAMWSPDSFLARHLVRDWYGPTPRGLALVGVFAAFAASVVPLILGPMALGALPRSRFRSLVLLWLALYLVVHSVIFGVSRMHFPLVPLLVLAVAGAFWADGGAVSRRRLLRRGAPWAALALAAWALAAPVQNGLYLAPGPRHIAVTRALAAPRGLPLPGTRYLTWSLALAEASRGQRERAEAILADPPHADLAWSLYLRGLLKDDPQESERLLARSLERDPELYAALVTLGWSRLRARDWDEGVALLERASALRPWDASTLADLRSARQLRAADASERATGALE